MKKCMVFILIALTSATFAQGKQKKNDKKEVKKEVQNAPSYTNDFPAYVIYNSQGQQVTYTQMAEALSQADICLFGEQHNDPISHWMELSLMKYFHQIKKEKLVTGAEMWETDNQLIMDEMMKSKLIDGKSYTESSKLWPNFTTDYKPMLVYAQQNSIPFVCTNIPRRYARIVYKKGIEYLDSLSDQAKALLPPMPVHFDLSQPVYAKMAAVFPSDEEFLAKQAANPKKKSSPMMGSLPSNLVKAQAIKDASMAHFILKNWEPGKFFYHFNGEFHSANHTSIMYYLNYYNPNVKVKTVSVIRQGEVFPLKDENNRADFNIIIPEAMTVTYIASPL